jgi:RNA polymerase sigma factor (sigma-70 family)
MEVEAMPAPGRGGPSLIPARLLGDEQLARAVEAGREDAFATLFHRHHQQLYRYCRSLVGNDQDAQDALQASLTKALVALRERRRTAPLRPWLFRIAHNESLTLVRSRRAGLELPDELPAADTTPELVESRERFATLVGDLQELAEAQRTALLLRELCGLSHEEIAEVLGISSGAAKQTILEARRSLQEFAAGRSWDCARVQELLSAQDRRTLRGRRVTAHLRACPACSDFAQAISERRAQMLALWPALPAVAATGLLAKLTGTASPHAGGGLGGATAGAAVKGLGASVPLKAAAVGLVAAAGLTTGALTVLHHARTPPPQPLARSSHTAPTGKPAASQHLSSAGAAPHHARLTTASAPAGPRQTRIRPSVSGAGGLGPGAASRGAGRATGSGAQTNSGARGGGQASRQQAHRTRQPKPHPAAPIPARGHRRGHPHSPRHRAAPHPVTARHKQSHRPAGKHRPAQTTTVQATTTATATTPASGSPTGGAQGAHGNGPSAGTPDSSANGKGGATTP